MIFRMVRLHIEKVKLSLIKIYSRRSRGAGRARTVGRVVVGWCIHVFLPPPSLLLKNQIDLILGKISACSHRLWHKNLSPIKPRSSRYFQSRRRRKRRTRPNLVFSPVSSASLSATF